MLSWLEQFVAHPPVRLSELEQHVGPLEVDYASEGFGSLVRPTFSGPARGRLRAGVRSLSATFAVDLHHEDPRRPRDMAVRSCSLGLDAPQPALRELLERRFGAGRTVIHDATYLEYGQWFYLDVTTAQLRWERERPEWALPRVAPSLREDFLATLVDRLACEATELPIVAALSSLAQAVGAEVSSPIRFGSTHGADGIEIVFRPGLPLAVVVDAFRWERPVAFSSDVHMSSWTVVPHAALAAAPRRAQLGRWLISPELAGWPRGPEHSELPKVGQHGPSSLYDLERCETLISSITVMRGD